MLTAAHSEINAQINLIGPRPKQAHTVFQTSFRTFNAPLSVSVTHDDNTPPSQFHLTATNNIGKSYVSLDNKYQGTFDLQTKLAGADFDAVNPQDAIADPSGNRGKRNYEFDLSSAARKFGWVGWGRRVDCPRQGHVAIASTHSPVILHLAGAGAADDDDDDL